MQDLYSENYTGLLKEIKSLSRKVLHNHIGERLNVVKLAIPSKLTYWFNSILIKIPAGFCRNWQEDAEIYVEIKIEQPKSLWKRTKSEDLAYLI